MRQKNFIGFLVIFFLWQAIAHAQDSLINAQLKAREIEYALLKKYQDSLKIRTLNNLIIITNQQRRVIMADSALITTALDELTKYSAGQNPQQLLDTIQRLKGRIEYLKLAPPYRGKFMSPKDYLMLLVLSLMMIIAGVLALVMLNKARKANNRAQQSEQSAADAISKQNECEKKLEEFNLILNQISGDRQKLIDQISELNKSILASRHDQIFLMEDRDKLKIENQQLKKEIEELKIENNTPRQSAIASAPSMELITENNLLKSENIQAKQTIMKLEEEIHQLKKALEEHPVGSPETENVQKYKLELQKVQQMLIQTEDKLREMEERNKFLVSEKDRLTAELNISMQSVKNMRDRLETVESEFLNLKQEKQNLQEKLDSSASIYAQLESLNAEILRWKSDYESLQQQLAQEIKIRKDIESDIQKLLGRLGGA